MHLRFPPRLVIPWTYARNYTIDQNLIRCCGFRWQSGFGWSQDLISIWHDEVLWTAGTPWVDRKLGVEFGIFNICYLDVLEIERLAGRFGCRGFLDASNSTSWTILELARWNRSPTLELSWISTFDNGFRGSTFRILVDFDDAKSFSTNSRSLGTSSP